MGKYLFQCKHLFFTWASRHCGRKRKSFSRTLLVPATHNQPSALDLLITKLCFSNSHLLREKKKLQAPERLALLRCTQRSTHEPFCQSKWWRFAGEWRHWRRSTCIEVEKEWERKERMGLNPPTSKLFPPAVSCDIYLLRWFCQKPSGLAVPPHSLICCLVLSRLSSEKEGVEGSAKDTPRGKNMAHRVHLETPHTIPYTRTHTNITPDDAQERLEGRRGIRHWLLLKGQWFVSSSISSNTAHI